MDIVELKKVLEKSWNKETATDGIWDESIPSLNQCAVTALVVQDFFGGDLLRCKMTNGDSHYWNKLADGSVVDLTIDQFKFIDPKPDLLTTQTRTRQYVLSYPNTMKRYGILLQRIAEQVW